MNCFAYFNLVKNIVKFFKLIKNKNTNFNKTLFNPSPKRRMSSNYFNPFFTVKVMDGLFVSNQTAAKVCQNLYSVGTIVHCQ